MGSATLLGVGVVALGLLLGFLGQALLRSWVGSLLPEGVDRDPPLRGEEIAVIRGGLRRLVPTVVTRLRRAGNACFDSGRLRPGSKTVPEDAPEIELALADALRRERNLNLGAVRRAIRPQAIAIRKRLLGQGLVLDRASWIGHQTVGVAPLLTGSVYLLFRARDLPRGSEGVAALCCAAMVAIAAVILVLRFGSPGSSRGRRRVGEIAKAHPPHPNVKARESLDPDDVARYAALYGERYWGPETARFLSGVRSTRGGLGDTDLPGRGYGPG